MPDIFAGLPFNDQFVAMNCEGDYPEIVARCSRSAFGDDGAITAGSFVLTSAFPFQTQGVQAGQTLVVTGVNTTNSQGTRTIKKQPGDLYSVTAVTGSTVTLGRIGQGAGFGAFPAGVTTVAGVAGLEFFIPTVSGLIASEFADVTRRLQEITDLSAVNAQTVITLTVDSVMRRLYFAASRGGEDDPFVKKSAALEARITTRLTSISRKNVLIAPSAGSSGTGFAASEFWYGPCDWPL